MLRLAAVPSKRILSSSVRGLAELARVQPAAESSAPQAGTVNLRRAMKKEGTIAEFFENLKTRADKPPLPPRFAALKREICKNPAALEHSWRAVLKELEIETEEIVKRGSEVRRAAVPPTRLNRVLTCALGLRWCYVYRTKIFSGDCRRSS